LTIPDAAGSLWRLFVRIPGRFVLLAFALALRFRPRALARPIRIVLHDADPAIGGQHLQPVYLATIALHRFRTQHFTARLTLDPANRIGQSLPLPAIPLRRWLVPWRVGGRRSRLRPDSTGTEEQHRMQRRSQEP
jgi:hypothetical protein